MSDSSEDGDGGLLFDIIGFDPRGVGYTTPKLECFPDYVSRQYWQSQGAEGETITSTNTSFGIKLSHGSASGQSCVDRAVQHNASIAYHMNSAPVVEDMLALLERHGEWRERETFLLLGSPSKGLRRRELAVADELRSELSNALHRTKWNAGEERLLYWGVSYGTVLGQLFAHLHPERLSRLVLDAVVDTDVYLNSKWDAHIEQSDDVLDFFFDSCSRSSNCAFRDGDVQTTQTRFNTLLQSLTDEPIPVASNSEPTISAHIVTSSDLRLVIRDAVYYPLQLFPCIDGILVDLKRGNGTTLALKKQSGLLNREQQLRRCGPDTAFDLRCHDPAAIEIEAVVSITCSNNGVIDSMSDEDFSSYVESMQNRNHVMGWYWAETQMPCRAWSVKAGRHVDGPLHATTAEPMLFMGNTVDPATPLHSALKIATAINNVRGR